ncbi:unnamed protein product [Trichogramma brassicae]|uniref:Uncharacterized protein n=1 Tax=Trichogramma brassicae TaxID=86971 RepID=A0A6H5ITI2_9HYME|nr:unnamed protein product [Trichogramma brassicae]
MDWEGPFSPAITAGNGRRGNNERTPRRRASRQRRQASGVGTRQRTPSPGEGRRPNGGGEPLLEEETRAMLEQLVAARQPVENGTARHSRRFFVARLKREVLLLEEGEATATLRRSGETTEESARVPTPPLAPVQEPSALPLPPPVQQVSYVAGLHGLVFQPFAVQQQRLPQTEYPLDGQQQRQLRRPGPYQEQQQHRQLPRRQPQQHQREEVRVEVRPLSPVAGPSSLSGNTAAPARIRGEKFWRPGAEIYTSAVARVIYAYDKQIGLSLSLLPYPLIHIHIRIHTHTLAHGSRRGSCALRISIAQCSVHTIIYEPHLSLSTRSLRAAIKQQQQQQ